MAKRGPYKSVAPVPPPTEPPEPYICHSILEDLAFASKLHPNACFYFWKHRIKYHMDIYPWDNNYLSHAVFEMEKSKPRLLADAFMD